MDRTMNSPDRSRMAADLGSSQTARVTRPRAATRGELLFPRGPLELQVVVAPRRPGSVGTDGGLEKGETPNGTTRTQPAVARARRSRSRGAAAGGSPANGSDASGMTTGIPASRPRCRKHIHGCEQIYTIPARPWDRSGDENSVWDRPRHDGDRRCRRAGVMRRLPGDDPVRVAFRAYRSPGKDHRASGRRAGVRAGESARGSWIASQSVRRLGSRTNGGRDHGKHHDPQPRRRREDAPARSCRRTPPFHGRGSAADPCAMP